MAQRRRRWRSSRLKEDVRKKGGNRKLVLQDLSVRRVSPACSSSKPLQPRRRRSVAIPCCRSPRSAAERGTIVFRVERRTRKKTTLPSRNGSGDRSLIGTAQWQGTTSRAEKKRVPLWHTWDLFPVLSFQPLCSSVQTQAVAGVQARVCPTAMERAAGPRAFVKRLGRVLHYAAKTLKMGS